MEYKKYLFLIVWLLYGTIGFSQETNPLNTEAFYDSIEFDNICLSKIIEIHQATGSLESIFSSSDTKNTNANGSPFDTINYKINGSLFSFEDSDETGDKKLYNIAYVKFGNNTQIKLFDGTTFRIGDSSSELDKFKKLDTNKIVFNQIDTGTSLRIEIDNNVISAVKIVFY